MSVDIDIDRIDSAADWDRLVERSGQATPFHRYGALCAQATHTDATCHRLVGYKGQEPVGLFPVFELQRGPITGAFSPPPYLWVHTLGPATIEPNGLNTRTAERRRRAFIEDCLDWIDREISPKLRRVTTDPRYEDVRPFAWRGFDATPGYTYVVDLTVGTEALLGSFSSDARSNTRYDGDYEIRVGDAAAAERIIEEVERRFDQQGVSFRLPPAFASDLYHALPDGRVRPYVCEVAGEFVGGIVTVEDERSIYRWQGAARRDAEAPVNDLLDWRIMRDAIDRGLTRYDLVGAGTPRINRYKSKFGPDPVGIYNLERDAPGIDTLLRLYRRIR
jgi:hypothetical protein